MGRPIKKKYFDENKDQLLGSYLSPSDNIIKTGIIRQKGSKRYQVIDNGEVLDLLLVEKDVNSVQLGEVAIRSRSFDKVIKTVATIKENLVTFDGKRSKWDLIPYDDVVEIENVHSNWTPVEPLLPGTTVAMFDRNDYTELSTQFDLSDGSMICEIVARVSRGVEGIIVFHGQDELSVITQNLDAENEILTAIYRIGNGIIETADLTVNLIGDNCTIGPAVLVLRDDFGHHINETKLQKSISGTSSTTITLSDIENSNDTQTFVCVSAKKNGIVPPRPRVTDRYKVRSEGHIIGGSVYRDIVVTNMGSGWSYVNGEYIHTGSADTALTIDFEAKNDACVRIRATYENSDLKMVYKFVGIGISSQTVPFVDSNRYFYITSNLNQPTQMYDRLYVHAKNNAIIHSIEWIDDPTPLVYSMGRSIVPPIEGEELMFSNVGGGGTYWASYAIIGE